ncbi:beta-eliminating lyase-related protein [Nakamurella sp. A5-74]|uniref:Beta-eliminating lyase-related protein n=1 Tax=Nakamurella sp. A5-74 TaxID=3158264 RepID=A0AAU8DMR4_9ACTN
MSTATPLHDPHRRHFASDNYAGVHPEILQALADANGGHQVAYGEDVYTERLQQVARRHFGDQAGIWPVWNGTGANVLSLQALLPRWGAVVCAETAHINTDENAAPERVAGLKLLTVPTPDGKLTPELIDRQAWGFGDEHRAQPAAVSITQTTELGSLYTAEQIRAVAEHAHALGLMVHLDGSRISNAAAALGTDLRSFTTDVGVDVVSLGGTKNGAMGAEAVAILNPELGDLGMPFLRKMNMQLASKMRFVAAQLIALYEGDLWFRSARQANAMAARLAAAVGGVEGVTVTQQVEANAVFAVLDRAAADRLREQYRFYDWNQATGEVRWMCAWDHTEDDVDSFVAALRAAL